MSNIEKLLNMLTLELSAVRERADIAEVQFVCDELRRLQKVEYEKRLEPLRVSLYLKATNGQPEGTVNGYKYTYYQQSRLTLDADKVRKVLSDLSDDEFKSLVYSENLTKPTLKLSKIK